MKKNQIILVVLTIIVLLVIGIFYFLSSNQPAKHSAIRIHLNQLSENNLQLQQIIKEAIYPAKENTNPYIEKYYQVTIKNKDKNILYQTKLAKQKTMMFFSYPGAERAPNITLHKDLVLYLPVYPHADQVVISDEQNNNLISINIAQYLE